MSPELLRSYTFRTTPLAILENCATKLYVPIRPDYVPTTFLLVNFKYVSRKYTFLYVPKHPSRNSHKLCHKVIRSYTSGVRSNDVPAGKLQICIQQVYVPIRSEQPLSQFSQIVLRSYTSGVRSNDVPAGKLQICVQKVYVPIRSYRTCRPNLSTLE